MCAIAWDCVYEGCAPLLRRGRISEAERKRREAEKLTAKDRVKRQRLRGQTLGGETTVWKTEQEMVLRQHYD